MTYDAAAHAWAAHLRDGGTDAWDAARWSDAATGGSAPAAPSAVHLELLRRFNLAGHGPVPAGLADAVLTTARPGRGPVDPPLPWPGRPAFGSPALDPAALVPELLVRLAAGVVVRLLADVPDPEPRPAPPAGRRAWPWRTGFVLHGTRTGTAPVRERLLAAGAVEGGRRPVHLVLGLPLELAMAQHWAGRVAGGGVLPWLALWRRAASTERLPDPVDTDRLAEQLAAEHPGRVHVVVAADPAGLASGALDVLGLTGRPGVPPPGVQLPRWDLQRRVNRLAPLARGPVTGQALARRAAPALDALAAASPDAWTEPAAAPAAHREWAARAAADLATRVDEAGYPVHGDPGVLARATPRTGRVRRGTVDRSQTLDLTLAACLRLWRSQEGPRR